MLLEQIEIGRGFFATSLNTSQICKQGKKCAARGLVSCSPSSSYTAASQGDESLLFNYFSLLFSLLCTKKTPNSDLRPQKHPVGEGKTVYSFFPARKRGENSTTVSTNFIKNVKCVINHPEQSRRTPGIRKNCQKQPNH